MYGELANTLAGAGGLGLATSLEDAMARTTPGTSPAEAIAAGHGIPRPYSPWAPGAPASFALDADRVSSAYGVRRDPISGVAREHKGIDIPASTGDDVRSVKAGTVIESDNRNGYGNTVVVDHGGGVTTRYAHLSARQVAVGDRVTSGQILGLVGQTGRATGSHLHLEVRQNGIAIDPLGPEAGRLIGKVVPGIERKAVSADDTHGASR
jgi:murein DD-endopeptidase MepM/ murein hydrolase activator NlpD